MFLSAIVCRQTSISNEVNDDSISAAAQGFRTEMPV